MNYGENAKRARIRAGMTIKELSEITDIAPNTIIGFEKGRIDAKISTVEILADALGISIDEYTGHFWRGKSRKKKEGGENGK